MDNQQFDQNFFNVRDVKFNWEENETEKELDFEDSKLQQSSLIYEDPAKIYINPNFPFFFSDVQDLFIRAPRL
jgi:hypothetical protein